MYLSHCPWNYDSMTQREVDVSSEMGYHSLHYNLQCILVDLLINTAKSSSSTSVQPILDLELIERAIIDVSEMLDRVLAYVRDVLSGQKKGDPAVGRYLMDTLGPSTEGLEKGGFNSSLQVNFWYHIYFARY